MHRHTGMSCEEVQRVIPWLLDDELDPGYGLEVEDHLGECEACQAILQREGQLRTTLRRAVGSVAAPARLRRRLNEAIEAERGRAGRFSRLWPAAAAAAILLAFVWRGAVGGFSADLDEVAVRHALNLPMDVVAADANKVQSYLNGKLGWAVQLPTLSSPSESLGGRVTQFNNHDAAYIRYNTARGPVSFFVYPDPGYGTNEGVPTYRVDNRQVVLKRVRGYQVARWRAHGMIYSAVSGLPEMEFQNIVLRGRSR